MSSTFRLCAWSLSGQASADGSYWPFMLSLLQVRLEGVLVHLDAEARSLRHVDVSVTAHLRRLRGDPVAEWILDEVHLQHRRLGRVAPGGVRQQREHLERGRRGDGA